MMGGAVKRCEAAAYEGRQPAPPHSTELWQEYRTTLQAWNAANQEFMNMTPAQTLQKMCQVFREAGETAPADSLNFLLVEYQQPPPLDVVLRDIDSLFKVNTVANTLDILGEFNFSSNSATETNWEIVKISDGSKCFN